MSDLSKVCDKLGNAAAPKVMQATVMDLDGYWLELHCDRHGIVMLPCRLMARRGHGGKRLSQVMAHLTCKVCHRPPARAWLNETHNRVFNHGAPPGWSVQLIPLPVIEAEAAE